jgi:hypothetical protein
MVKIWTGFIDLLVKFQCMFIYKAWEKPPDLSQDSYCDWITEQTANPFSECGIACGAQLCVSWPVSLCSRHEQSGLVLWIGAEQVYITSRPGVSWNSDQSEAQHRICLGPVWGQDTAAYGEIISVGLELKAHHWTKPDPVHILTTHYDPV